MERKVQEMRNKVAFLTGGIILMHSLLFEWQPSIETVLAVE